MQEGYFPNQRDMEIKQSRDLEDTSRTHIHSDRKVREQVWSRNIREQELTKKNQLNRLHQRTRHDNIDHSQQVACWWMCTFSNRHTCANTLQEHTEQSGNTRKPKRASKSREGNSTLIWDLGLMLNESESQHISSKWLDETMTDITDLRSTQRNVQNTLEKKNKLHAGHRKEWRNSWTVYLWTGNT